MRTRMSAPVVALLAVVLLAGPVAAVAPASPATGSWSKVGTANVQTFAPMSGVYGTRIGPDGKLYAWGGFTNAAGVATADRLAVLDPATGKWSGLGSNGLGDGALGSYVQDIAWYGGKLYAAGSFLNAGGVAGASYVASWNGTTWAKVGTVPLTAKVLALSAAAGFLYAGGDFVNAGGDPTGDHVAAFDGTAWHGLSGMGAINGAITDRVYDVDAQADGRVYVAGQFMNNGPSGKCDLVCWWDPASESWNPVGGSVAPDNVFAPGSAAATLLVYGSRVYVGGGFENVAGNKFADTVVAWDGTKWTNLGANAAKTDGAIKGGVYGLTRYGAVLIVSGSFFDAGSVAAADSVAIWNGAKWMAAGNPAPDNMAMSTMVSGRVMYLSGGFSSIAGLAYTACLAAYGLPGVPTAPLNLAGVSGTAKVTLTWSAPATTNGGGPVRDYVVQYRKSGTTTWSTFADGVKSTTGAVVTGLTSGATYYFRVAAKSDWGMSAYTLQVSKKAN